MFNFNNEFDRITGSDGIMLEIIEKNCGDDIILPFYYYNILVNGTVVGKISIRIGDNYHSYYNGHAGYEIDEAYRGNKYSLAALKLVLEVAKFHCMDRIYLTCRKSNYASQRIISLAGAVHLEDVSMPKDFFAWFEGIEEHSIFELKL